MGISPAMNVAIQHWDRSSALLDGRVSLPNVAFVGLPNAVCWAGLFSGVFDAAELPLARFVFCHDQGDPLIALPIFPDRLFLQQYIYVRRDEPANDLSGFRGRRMIVPGYYFTASFWSWTSA
jgi:4,5-dihydroxyphthalate decarboxylase